MRSRATSRNAVEIATIAFAIAATSPFVGDAAHEAREARERSDLAEIGDASAPAASPRLPAKPRPVTCDGHGGCALSAASGHLAAAIDARGANVTASAPSSADGRAGPLHARRIGRGANRRSLADAWPRAANGRVELARAAGVTEWFAAAEGGVEHGIDLAAREPGDGPLAMEVVGEGLVPTLARGGRSITLRDAAGRAVLTYGALAAADADGRALPATMHVEEGAIVLEVIDAGARYPIAIDPMVRVVAEGELLAPDATVYANFGTSVAIDGALAIVGAPSTLVSSDASYGAAYVYGCNGAGWTQQAKLVVARAGLGDRFGGAVAISGTTVIVGRSTAQGTDGRGAYLFRQVGSKWVQEAALDASSGNVGVDVYSVALADTTAVVGARDATFLHAAARVFEKRAGAWSLRATLLPAPTDGAFSFADAVATDGTTVLVGARGEGLDGTWRAGAVHVYTRGAAVGGDGAADLVLRADDATSDDHFGTSVALRGAFAIVGASNAAVDGTPARGAAYVFERTGASWVQRAKLVASDGAVDDGFGASVAIDGANALVGAPRHASNGAAYLFVRDGATWTEQSKLGAPDPAYADGLGRVALRGGAILVGAPWKEAGGLASRGKVYAFGLERGDAETCCASADCTSGFCVDGVCCDSRCGGVCEACRASATGKADGVCALVLDGLDPRATCQGGASCAASTLTTRTCDGAGACRQKTTACADGCEPSGAACRRRCAGDADCDEADYCSAGWCTKKLPDATTCGANGACASGYCVDGVCCNQPCQRPCEACAEPGSVGRCAVVAGAPRAPRNACPGDDGCRGACDGVQREACVREPAGKECGAGCSLATSSFCDAYGTCAGPAPCPRNLECDAAAHTCKSACSADADCRDGGRCVDANGAPTCMGPELSWGCTSSAGDGATTVSAASGMLALLVLGCLRHARDAGRRRAATAGLR